MGLRVKNGKLVPAGTVPMKITGVVAGTSPTDVTVVSQTTLLTGTNTNAAANTWSGVNAYTGANTHTGTETFSNAAGVTTDIVTERTAGNGTAIKAKVGVVSGATLTSATTPSISATTSGSIYTFAAAAITVTLPACSATNVGLTYDFVTTTIATAQIINTTGSDVFLGSVYSTLAVVNATNDTACGSSTANKTMTMNGTTTGGLPGSRIRVTCISATQWLVSGFVIGASGTQTTLFSN